MSLNEFIEEKNREVTKLSFSEKIYECKERYNPTPLVYTLHYPTRSYSCLRLVEAYLNGDIAGYIEYQWNKADKWGYIYEIWVPHELRTKKVGTNLLSNTLEYMTQRGIKVVYASVTGPIEFFSGFGFKSVNEPSWPLGMVKHLTELRVGSNPDKGIHRAKRLRELQDAVSKLIEGKETVDPRDVWTDAVTRYILREPSRWDYLTEGLPDYIRKNGVRTVEEVLETLGWRRDPEELKLYRKSEGVPEGLEKWFVGSNPTKIGIQVMIDNESPFLEMKRLDNLGNIVRFNIYSPRGGPSPALERVIDKLKRRGMSIERYGDPSSVIAKISNLTLEQMKLIDEALPIGTIYPSSNPNSSKECPTCMTMLKSFEQEQQNSDILVALGILAIIPVSMAIAYAVSAFGPSISIAFHHKVLGPSISTIHGSLPSQ